MPRDIEHIVETHQLARQRVAAGLPVWDRRINIADIWNDATMSFEEQRDALVARIRISGWLVGRNEFDRLVEVVDNLADAEDFNEFNAWWDELYDHADADRVWIATF